MSRKERIFKMMRFPTSTIFVIALVYHHVDHSSSEDILRVTTDALREHLDKAFSKVRSDDLGATKTETKKYISDFFESLSEKYASEIMVQPLSFAPLRECSSPSDQCTGMNYMWILPGERYGTAEDKLSLIGSHYDTVSRSPGVNDNGSGMAAMLEAAKILAESKFSCPLLNSVAFVAFDWEEYGILGSELFMSFLGKTMEDLNIPEVNFVGAIILDMVLNWDNTENSQQLPPAFDFLFSDTYNNIKARNFKGDFITIISRLDDSEIGHNISDTWETLSQPSKYRAETITIPVSGRGTPEDVENYFDLLRSDHSSFWNTTGRKAVFLTDSADFRGNMQECYHRECDNMNGVTGEKLEFLAKVTETLVRYEIEISTEQKAETCAGAPQDNWAKKEDPPISNGDCMAASSLLAVGMLIIITFLYEN